MSKEQKQSVAATARRLGLPYYKVYQTAVKLNISEIGEEELIHIMLDLQARAIPFRVLARVFGANRTLGDLAVMERAKEKLRED